MRLQLSLGPRGTRCPPAYPWCGVLGVALLLPGLCLAADGSFSTKVQVYTDTDATVVVSPHLRAGATTNSGTTVDVAYTEDVVSSASVDVRSAASPRIHDVRQEVDLGISQTLAGYTTLGIAGVHATEKDYLSNGASLLFSSEFNQRNTTLAARVGYMANLVGRAGDPLFQAPLNDTSADVTLTQTLTPTDIAQLALTVARQQGLIASPYRKVWIGDGEFVVPETDPTERNRIAAAIGAKHSFGAAGVLHGDFRLYWDTFGILSQTADARWTFDWSSLAIRLRYRFYSQSGAFFYQPTYDTLKAYVSSDREMSPFTSHLTGVKVEWLPLGPFATPVVRVDGKVEAMFFNYPLFPRLPERTAINVQAGAAVDF